MPSEQHPSFPPPAGPNVKLWGDFRLLSAVTILSIFLFAMWFRTGIIPASSTGDDIWYSDSAYTLLTTGDIRRPIHDDVIGSAQRDFLPPIIILFQWVSFLIFGVTQFSMGVAGSLILTVNILLFALLSYRITGDLCLAFFACICMYFLPTLTKIALNVRFESIVVFFLLLTVIFILYPNGNNGTGYIWRILAGFTAGLACISHYAIAPYILIASALFLYNNNPSKVPLCYFALGMFVSFSLFALYIYPDFSFFIHQIAKFGKEFDFVERAKDLLIEPIKCLEYVIFLVILVITYFKSDGNNKLIVYTSFIGLILSILYFHGIFIYSSVILVIGLLHVREESIVLSKFRMRHIIKMMAVSATMIMLALDVKAAKEWRYRDIDFLEKALIENADLSGLVLIDRPGWLALREHVPLTNLHEMRIGGDQTFIMNSKILFDPEYATDVSAIVVWPQYFEDHKKNLPLVKEIIDNMMLPMKFYVTADGIAAEGRGESPYEMLVFTK